METKIDKVFNWLTIAMLVLCAAGAVCGILSHLPWYGLVWIFATAVWVIVARMYKASWQAEVKELKEDLELCREERNNAWKESKRYQEKYEEKLDQNLAFAKDNKQLAEQNIALLSKMKAMELALDVKETPEEKPKAKRSKKKISEIKEAVKDITENIKK